MQLNNAERVPGSKLEGGGGGGNLTRLALLLQCVFSSNLFSSSRDEVNGCLASSFPYPVFMVVTLVTLFEMEKA